MKIFFAIFLAFSLSFSDDFDDFSNEFSDDKQVVFDPLSGYNRAMTNVNDFIYLNIFDPVIYGYKVVVPEQGRTAIGNFFDNLLFPIRFINNILQFKFGNAKDETLRFIANTIMGFGGISDIATTYYKIPRHDEDFGQTLGYWGIGKGFHVVLPILGPSNLRDMFGMAGDYFSNPTTYFDEKEVVFGVKAFENLNSNSLQIPYKEIRKDAIELYPFLRDAYEQRRDFLIKE
ncbi:ABC transporter [Campylobacter pinnipediorum subsp. pinnipediorum]|uniref:ABC transporter n=1 Tax=Campylobacter pinnipediorum subsp. pinnipediorum TaxID=1660067 RepID=A0AAX0LA53_9BACT|nr:VacJ family lipoprotein [Campylobacter pinnipediorum]AQW84574.1 lipid asymmetry ABC transporter MlaABCDEF, lipoprotein MlaA [Campylobacter pinnipediorum subsp. pinnipediorum]OPA77289.1 ABC transporter [Campylobacter pinnipediorum subsp. pinnipediorum]